jgi:hypothetical protein
MLARLAEAGPRTRTLINAERDTNKFWLTHYFAQQPRAGPSRDASSSQCAH